jgi:hypothetical protein
MITKQTQQGAGKVITLYKLTAGKYDELTEFVKFLGGDHEKAANKSHNDLI